MPHVPPAGPASARTSLEKHKIRIVLLEGIHPRAVETFAGSGYSRVECLPAALAGDALRETIADAHFIGIRSGTTLTADVLAAAPKLVGIGAFCIGTNQIDLDAAMMRGIPVFNAPFANTRSVAELVVAEIILLMRGIPAKNALAHRGVWAKAVDGAREVRGKTLGIIGYGRIGSQVSVLAESLGLSVCYHDIAATLPLGNARALPSLDAVLEAADVVTLHVPESPQTKGLIGRRELGRMRPGGLLINASRGTVVDIEAACEALDRGQLAGGAFDVFPQEPAGRHDEFVSELRRFDNVILSPHIAGSTVEAQANIGAEVAEKLVRYSDNGSTVSAVNFPEVSLPPHPGSHRLLHVHHNVPGILSRINAVFSQEAINITGQYLMTNAKIGYVVCDVAEESSAVARRTLASIEGTIRTRTIF